MADIFMNYVDSATTAHKSPAVSLIYIDVNRKRMAEINMVALSNATAEKWSSRDERDETGTPGRRDETPGSSVPPGVGKRDRRETRGGKKIREQLGYQSVK